MKSLLLMSTIALILTGCCLNPFSKCSGGECKDLRKTTSVAPAVAPAVIENPEYKNVHFRIGSTELSEESQAALNDNAAFLSRHPRAKVGLQGAADSATGSQKRNEFLAKGRADVTRDYLLSKGVNSDQIAIKPHVIGDERAALFDSEVRTAE